jgi:bromodomain-containing protein 8
VIFLQTESVSVTQEFMTGTRSRRETTSSEQRPGPSTPAQSTPSASTAQAQALPNKRFQTVITLLHSQISQHRNGNIFHNPIKPSEAPDYHEIIKRPMDLKTIKARIKDGVIRTSTDFQRDVYLMFANAMMYNRPGSDIALMAEEVDIFFL